MKLKKKHQITLRQIRSHPKPSNLKWREFEGFIIALGFRLTEPGGSLKVFDRDGLTWDYHRPHPRPDVDKAAISDLDKFLKENDVV